MQQVCTEYKVGNDSGEKHLAFFMVRLHQQKVHTIFVCIAQAILQYF